MNNKKNNYPLGRGSNVIAHIKVVSSIYTPTLIPNVNNIVQVSAGSNHSLLLNNKGHVYSFGNNYSFKLGFDTDDNDINTPTLIPEFKLF